MELKTDQTEKGLTLIITGALTIESATDLKAGITRLPDKPEKVLVDLEGVTEIDLSCIQIFCASNHPAQGSKRRFIQKGGQPELITRALVEAGYTEETGCHGKPCKNCFWEK